MTATETDLLTIPVTQPSPLVRARRERDRELDHLADCVPGSRDELECLDRINFWETNILAQEMRAYSELRGAVQVLNESADYLK